MAGICMKNNNTRCCNLYEVMGSNVHRHLPNGFYLLYFTLCLIKVTISIGILHFAYWMAAYRSVNLSKGSYQKVRLGLFHYIFVWVKCELTPVTTNHCIDTTEKIPNSVMHFQSLCCDVRYYDIHLFFLRRDKHQWRIIIGLYSERIHNISNWLHNQATPHRRIHNEICLIL